MTLYRYRCWELDEINGAPTARISPWPSDLESCFLRRRRSKMTLPELARHMGVSRFWVNQMERGAVNSEPLIAYWKSA